MKPVVFGIARSNNLNL